MKQQLIGVTFLAGISQIAALAKTWIVARQFGVGPDLDGYNLAFTAPAVIVGVISGSIQIGLFPICSQLRQESGEVATVRIERMVLVGVTALALLISLLLFAVNGLVGGWIARDATVGVVSATIFAMKFASAAVVLNVAGDLLGYQLAMRGKFMIAAAAPIANVVVSSAMLLAWPTLGLLNLVAGTTVGLALQVSIVALGAHVHGIRLFGDLPSRAEFTPAARRILGLSVWMFPALLFSNVTNALPPMLLTRFGDGAVSAFGYAFRIHQSIVQLLVMAAAPVILARFSDLVARKEWATLDRLQRKALLAAAVIGLTAVVAVWVLGAPLLKLVFGNGRFDDIAVARVAKHWLCLTFGLGTAIFGNVLAKRIQASGGAPTLALLSFVGTAVLVLVTIAMRGVAGESSVSLALTLSSAVLTIAMLIAIRAYDPNKSHISST